eukprot:TRINITY_DN72788_c0_g1_i1.p1 TRINITY_DN72788_c0_g1~~TRINITY_DN72788_c0_g1_i1.p1  ORF type:complete len:2783 (+),score=391.35 TRINITY_DN72788_c0_g1_i1:96-8444(+)
MGPVQVLLLVASFHLQPRVSGEPARSHLRSCITGQQCVVNGIAGTGLGNGDRILLLRTCGQGPSLDGMPGDFGETLPASYDGTFFQWPGPIGVDGGEYRMCWCSVADVCTSPTRFTLDIGSLTVTGPASGVEQRCVSGRSCAIVGIEGVYLQDGDSVMVLSGCNEGSAINGFPNDAQTNNGALAGTEHGWGELKISAVGGVYSLCWCAKGATCIQPSDHRFELGTMTVVGPSGEFVKACDSYEPCTWSGLTGEGLADGDRMMILTECGSGTAVPGFPNEDIAVASGGGSSYTFGSSNNMVTAGGAEYEMCWCQGDSQHVCTGPPNFRTKAGILILSGASSGHDYSCTRGSFCTLEEFQGVGLQDGDKIQILFECGVGAAPSGWPNSGIAVATANGYTYSSWASSRLQTQPGNYRICWCRRTWNCNSVAGFKLDAGALRVVEMDVGQTRSCHVQAPCKIQGLTGKNLRNGDLLKIMTACGVTGSEVPGWPRNGTSLPATDFGRTFSWGIIESVQADVGSYKMCWCPSGSVTGCKTAADFASEAGTMQLRGPETLGLNATCVTAQVPDCIVGPILKGVGLSYGSDRVVLVRSNETCGIHDADSVVGGGLPGKLVQGNKMVHWGEQDLPYGGAWKMCYCASFDSGLDEDAAECSSKEDFSATAGILFVEGAYPDQTVNCTRNQICNFDLSGYGLSTNLHRLALADQASDCGSGASADTATRRRRDFTGNPYVPSVVTAEGALAFAVDPVQALGAFYICFCVPAPASGRCSTDRLSNYYQRVGYFDVRGATPGQTFSCGRGGPCVLEVQGRGLSEQDRVKIVNSTTDCSGPAQETGFFKSLLPADPAPATTSASARFSLGQVTAGGTFKVCYCANLDGCNSIAKYTHMAGLLEVLEPLSDLQFVSATSASITVKVTSRMFALSSRVRCAATEFEPPYMPNGADVTNGLNPGGLAKGETSEPTKQGENVIELFFKTFVKAQHQYRVWCVESSAQSFILPPSPSGALVFTPQGIEAPSLRVFPNFLWPKALFYAQLFNVYSGMVTARRLASTEVRVQTRSSPYMCNQLEYEDAVPMQVEDSGTPGQNNARLITTSQLEASPFRLFLCFFAGPRATAIALTGSDRMSVQTQVPSYAIKRMDGLVLTRFYRGLLIKVVISNGALGTGLLHWTTAEDFAAQGCAGASRAPPAAQSVKVGETSFFKIEEAAGRYALCYLGIEKEGSSTAPFNSLGIFELTDVIHAVNPAVHPPSTRNTVRLNLEVRMPGTVTCIARKSQATVSTSDFSLGVLHSGRGSVVVDPAAPGVDPEFPRDFPLELPLVLYERSGDPLRVWCLHSSAESVPFPATADGVLVPLQVEEAFVTPDPAFIWHGAQFRLSLLNTPDVNSKRVGMHEPTLPASWRSDIIEVAGVKSLRYTSSSFGTANEHPAYTAWLNAGDGNLCDNCNATAALAVDQNSNTKTGSWFKADARQPFVCFWASPASFPHLVGKIDIITQPPEPMLEVVSQVRPHVYRGVDLTVRLRHGSSTGGRLLIIKKAAFDGFGGACQDMTIGRRLNVPSIDARAQHAARARRTRQERWARLRALQARSPASRALQQATTSPPPSGLNCTNSPRRNQDLKLLPAQDIFPNGIWGVYGEEGMNCTRDYRLYWNPALAKTSILADKANRRYILITSNESVMQHFVQKIRKLSEDGISMPINNSVVVHKDWTTLAESNALQWVLSTQNCNAKLLLDAANPMYEEGAENLPLSQYLEASLELQGFDFLVMAWLPKVASAVQKDAVCGALQQEAPVPERQETIWDIDKLGLGRTVKSGLVYVPSKINDTASFLHTEPLGEYVVCYAGDEQDKTPIFNPIGLPFKSVDVLSRMVFVDGMASTSLYGYLNVTSELPGLVRCNAFLDTLMPPQNPDSVFVPDTSTESYLGESDLVQYTAPGMSKVITLRLRQDQIKYMEPAGRVPGLPPSMYVWCAHKGSTVLYPSQTRGVQLDVQARIPPSFIYKQFNQSVASIALTLQLEFTPVVVEFAEQDFPRSYYDAVNFQSRPAMPGGLDLNSKTGAISGIPAKSGAFQRTIIAVSANPPRASVSFEMTINVKDVLGLRFTSASADSILLSIAPRSTNIFGAQKVFLLTRKRTEAFTQLPEEFFCVADLDRVPYKNQSQAICTIQSDVCCCSSYILAHMPVQDIRILTRDCGLQATGRYHTAGLVEGILQTSDSVAKPARLRSSIKVDSTMPPEVLAKDKKPVNFDIVILMPFEEYKANMEANNKQLKTEMNLAVSIPQDLVRIQGVKEGKGGTVVDISFYVEPRCLQDLGYEAELLSFGINTKEGCNLVAPVEYMNELKTQLSSSGSSLFYRPDLSLLKKISPDKSFSFSAQHFCNREPLWEYGAVAENVEACPYDLMKLGGFILVGATLGVMVLLSLIARLSRECGACNTLSKVRLLDITTPLMGVYTTAFDYTWLAYLKGNAAHPLHDTLFMGCLCCLFLCFVINGVALRMTITTFILDTPWWRKNRRRLRIILLLSVFSPRFFRMTRSNIGNIDRTHIHFGTPSKMAVVFSNLGLATLMQDIPMLLVQLYVWLIWRNLAPKVTLLCFVLGGQSVLTTALHHIFSRSQRAAYERVVKLLGVRRLTAGFFDVSAGVGSQAAKGGMANSGGMKLGDADGQFHAEDVLDPTKLDPVQAAMYVAQMYDKQAIKDRENEKKQLEDEEGSLSSGSSSNHQDDDDLTPRVEVVKKEEEEPQVKVLYPPNLFDKMRRFYSQHDPTKLAFIGRGTEAVDEEALDADLKKKFGVGLDSLE